MRPLHVIFTEHYEGLYHTQPAFVLTVDIDVESQAIADTLPSASSPPDRDLNVENSWGWSPEISSNALHHVFKRTNIREGLALFIVVLLNYRFPLSRQYH